MRMMNVCARRSVRCAFIANTIPKKRSHAISSRVNTLDTSDNTAKYKEQIFGAGVV